MLSITGYNIYNYKLSETDKNINVSNIKNIEYINKYFTDNIYISLNNVCYSYKIKDFFKSDIFKSILNLNVPHITIKQLEVYFDMKKIFLSNFIVWHMIKHITFEKIILEPNCLGDDSINEISFATIRKIEFNKTSDLKLIFTFFNNPIYDSNKNNICFENPTFDLTKHKNINVESLHICINIYKTEIEYDNLVALFDFIKNNKYIKNITIDRLEYSYFMSKFKNFVNDFWSSFNYNKSLRSLKIDTIDDTNGYYNSSKEKVEHGWWQLQNVVFHDIDYLFNIHHLEYIQMSNNYVRHDLGETIFDKNKKINSFIEKYKLYDLDTSKYSSFDLQAFIFIKDKNYCDLRWLLHCTDYIPANKTINEKNKTVYLAMIEELIKNYSFKSNLYERKKIIDLPIYRSFKDNFYVNDLLTKIGPERYIDLIPSTENTDIWFNFYLYALDNYGLDRHLLLIMLDNIFKYGNTEIYLFVSNNIDYFGSLYNYLAENLNKSNKNSVMLSYIYAKIEFLSSYEIVE